MEQREWGERTENRLETGSVGDRLTVSAGTAKSSQKDGTGRDAWDVFAASGKIQDYLIYRRIGNDRDIY